jgi:Ca2+-transporting ATPase
VLDAHSAEVAEATLTGESAPVAKTPAAVAADAPLAEHQGMLYMNTVVTRGRAEMLVTATGMATEMGKLAGMIGRHPESATPLQSSSTPWAAKLAAIAGLVVALIFILGFRPRRLPWTQAAMTAVALAVAAIPEGLPAVVTVTLAMGMWRMAKRRAILKKLAAVETLGSHHGDLLRQDRHPDPEPDDRPRLVFAGADSP